MKYLLIIIFILYGCTFITSEKQSQDDVLLFKNVDTASIQLFPNDSLLGNRLLINEINYGIHHLELSKDSQLEDFITKKTTLTEYYTWREGNISLIKIELFPISNPSNSVLTIIHKCNNIILALDIYKTETYGCCGGDDKYQFYDYQNNLIIEGNGDIITARNPNSQLKFYVSFIPSFNDSTILGYINLSYNSQDSYKVILKSNPLISEYCFQPETKLQLKSNDHKDNYDDISKTYKFWSLNKVKTKDGVNGIIIQLDLDCDLDGNLDTINIPIINGKPFGKDERIQEYNFDEKN